MVVKTKPDESEKDDAVEKDEDGKVKTKDKDVEKDDDEDAAPVKEEVVFDTDKIVRDAMEMDKLKENTKEHVDALLGAETLTEDFKGRATTLWNASVNEAVRTRVETVAEKLTEEAKAFVEAKVAEIEESMEQRVDAYLSYVCEQWVEENRLAIEHGIRDEIAESFMTKMHTFFMESYIDIPESKVDVVAELRAEVAALKESVEASAALLLEETAKVNKLTADAIFKTVSEGLADTQAVKLKALVEDVEFEDADKYRAKIVQIREAYMNGGSKPDEGKPEVITEDTKKSDPKTLNYADYISKTAKVGKY